MLKHFHTPFRVTLPDIFTQIFWEISGRLNRKDVWKSFSIDIAYLVSNAQVVSLGTLLNLKEH